MWARLQSNYIHGRANVLFQGKVLWYKYFDAKQGLFKMIKSDFIVNFVDHNLEFLIMITFILSHYSAINVQNALFIHRCWHQRHGVIKPGMAEIAHLCPLILISVKQENIL